MSQNFQTHQYQYFNKLDKEIVHQYTIHAPPKILEFKTKNAKNHAISLLQMQGCPQYNIKKKNKNFSFKDS
jgi:hypothetical protein